MPPLRVAIGVPAYGFKVDMAQVPMWISLGAALSANEDKLQLGHVATVHMCPVDHARNTIIYEGLEAGCDWVFMIDADIFHTTSTGADGSDILQMIWSGNKVNAAVVGAPVLARRKDAKRMALRQTPYGWAHLEPAEYEGQVVPVDRLATAFMAVNLGWLRTSWPETPWFVTTNLPGGKPTIIGEDYSFCDGIRARGGAVLCDGRLLPKHAAGRKIMGEDDL